MTAESAEDRGDLDKDAGLPLIADPSTAALLGTVAVLALLMPPVLIVVLIAIFLRWLARRRCQDLSSDVDREYERRFQSLEDSILGGADPSIQGEP